MNGLVFLKSIIFGLVIFYSQFTFAQDYYESPELTNAHEQVNINRADAETIAMILSGIGISKAEAIVAYREENGIFKTVEDLSMVKGVGEITLLNNEGRILVE